MSGNEIRTRINLTDAVMDCQPQHPPCFLNQYTWVEYLKSAAASQNHAGEQKVILVVSGNPQFNMNFNFCEDCTSKLQDDMKSTKRCEPNYLLELKEKK